MGPCLAPSASAPRSKNLWDSDDGNRHPGEGRDLRTRSRGGSPRDPGLRRVAEENLVMIDVIVPREQEGTQAVVRSWLQAVGDRVEVNDPLVELETAKVSVAVERTRTRMNSSN